MQGAIQVLGFTLLLAFIVMQILQLLIISFRTEGQSHTHTHGQTPLSTMPSSPVWLPCQQLLGPITWKWLKIHQYFLQQKS